MEIRGDGSHVNENFAIAKSVLLGSEVIRFVAEEKSGFIVLSDRRFVYLKKEKTGYKIQNAVPIDLLTGSELEKKDTLKIEFHKIYESGILAAKFSKSRLDFRLADIKLKRPDNSDESAFYFTMDEFNSVFREILGSSPFTDGVFKGRDYSYLQSIPETVTRDGILHLNTILTDRPDENELYGKAKDAFGENPYILINTMELDFRGYLFVVGTKAMMFLSGNYSHGSVSKMNLVAFEPPQILNISSDWTKKNPKNFHISKPVQEFDKVKVKEFKFTWNPPKADDVARVPWFCEPANAVWIIADMAVDQQKELLKANFGTGDEIDDPRIKRQRYYW